MRTLSFSFFYHFFAFFRSRNRFISRILFPPDAKHQEAIIYLDRMSPHGSCGSPLHGLIRTQRRLIRKKGSPDSVRPHRSVSVSIGPCSGTTLHPGKDLAVSPFDFAQDFTAPRLYEDSTLAGCPASFGTRRLCSHLADRSVQELPVTCCTGFRRAGVRTFLHHTDLHRLNTDSH
jgi:hypothetical protein